MRRDFLGRLTDLRVHLASFVMGVVALASLSAAAACGSSDNNGESDAGADATEDGVAPANDGGTGDGQGTDDDAGGDGADPLPDVDAGRWDYLDLELANPHAGHFEGSAFDGRFLYLAPRTSGLVGRFDTQKRFRSLASWSFFDVSKVPLPNSDAGAGDTGFAGAIFDGRYVYLVPWSNSVGPNQRLARFDTTASFEDPAAWHLFDLAAVSAATGGYIGGAFDGRYVYLIPNANSAGADGVVVRYDTQASFDAASSYQSFDVGTVNAQARGFFGGIFDGKYVYLVPFSPTNDRSGLVVRYDTSASFTQAASWTTFDTTAVNAGAKGFNGGAFDGRYVYLVPGNNALPHGLLTRYDTQLPFGAAASWTAFDLSAAAPSAKGFVGGAFDGRFLYLSPFSAVLGQPNDLVVGYDTRSPLGDGGAFTTFSLSTLDPYAKGYGGGGFDGRYVYFIPYQGSVIVRLDAHDPPGLPPHLGSFL